MLVKKYYLQDIKNFEEENNISLLNYLNEVSILGLIHLVMLGNKNCNEERAGFILDNYLMMDGNTIETAYLEIKRVLLAEGYIENKEDNDNTKEKIDTKEYRNLTEIYTKLCFQMMEVGVSYSEFWSMSTYDMYQAFNHINRKVINETNKQLEMAYVQAGLIGSSVWGKLPNEVPRVGEMEELPETIETEYGEMDKDSYLMMVNMKSITKKGGSK